MKKIFVVLIIAGVASFIGCERAHNNTAGDTRDSSASHGYSGPAATDTIDGSAAPFGESTSGTDTSSTGDTTDAPSVDMSSPKKH